MKILMVSEDVPHSSMGGLARHTLALARALAGCGHQIDFMGNNLTPLGELGEDIGFLGAFFPDLPMRRIGWKEVACGIYNPLKRPVIAWRFAKAIRRKASGYDVVHYHGHFPLIGAYIPQSINFIQTRHDQGSDCLLQVRFRDRDICRATSPFDCAACITENPKTVQRVISASAVWVYRKLVARAFRRHKTIFVSEMLQRNFCRTAGEQRWGEVIHNFVDYLALKKYASASSNVRRSNITTIFVAAKLYEAKGVGELLKVLHPNIPSTLQITIAGDGIDEAMLRARFNHERIKFLGWQGYPATIQYMSEADAVVVPSIVEESCATTVIEALALGKQTFALNRGGTAELKRYERFPHQLSLFESVEELVRAVLKVPLAARRQLSSDDKFDADASIAVRRVLDVYSRPHR